MSVVDSHQHFWDLSKFDYSWMGDGDSVLKQNHLPEMLKPQMDEAGVDRTVIVQAVSSIDEAFWLLDLADVNEWIAGVVAWVDLQSPTVADDLDALQKREKFCGVRLDPWTSRAGGASGVGAPGYCIRLIGSATALEVRSAIA